MRTAFLFTALATALMLSGCAKKTAKVVPPPPPGPSAPNVTLAANPSEIQPGQSSQLTWQANNADEITIAGLGKLPPSGSRLVKPSASTTYTIIARGPGGANEASTRITVNSATIAKASSLSDEDLVRRNIKDVFFEYDRSAIGSTEVSSVQRDEEFLQQHPSIKVLIEGHCDDRGSEEYNIALGSSRAETLKQALEQKGIDSGRLKTVSYGKEKPFCAEDNEQCWHQNRVDHFAFER